VPGLPDASTCTVVVTAGPASKTLKVTTLPRGLPGSMDGSFNILLSSCYSQPEDGGGLLGTIASEIKLRPDIALLLGDQIYGDLPINEDLPPGNAEVARVLARKYQRNFTGTEPGLGGLGAIFERAPIACVADDHEYWNNYPYKQTQLPKTWTKAGRKQWETIARELYEDYQLQGDAGGTQRLSIEPLEILIVDMRSGRDDQFQRLVSDECLNEIRQWAQDLLDARQAGQPAFGMLVSGQALMVPPADEAKRVSEDAELVNYAQFTDDILPILEQLTGASIPIVYVTGDVHWGRIAHATDAATGNVALYEVIVSPSRLIRIPAVDKFKEALNAAKGLFGGGNPWPRHGSPVDLPRQLRQQGRLVPDLEPRLSATLPRRGDQIAVMSLARAGQGIDFKVMYYGISGDKALSKSVSSPVYSLRNL
jgi:hypothetical protein